MTNDDLRTIGTIATPVLVLLGRLSSWMEHRKNGKQNKKNELAINDIRVLVNGEVEKRIIEAKEQGRREAIEEIHQNK